jgi:hypothetical protein
MLNKLIVLFVFLTSNLVFGLSSKAQDRVPQIFTGDSSAPAYQSYSRYKNKKDTRSSVGFKGYYLNQAKINSIINGRGVSSMHVHVRDIAKDGICEGTCFRAFVYLNGDVRSGEHVATFVVSPGTGRRTPYVENKPLRRHTRSLAKYERPTQFGNYDMYRIYGSKSYPSATPNMPNAMFFLDAIALHGSFDTVDGNKRSHGCVRMFPDESYFVHSLAIEAGGNVTFDVLHTR